MKAKTVFSILLVAMIFTISCRVKESCELNHTGTISVTNNLENEIEVYIDNAKVFDLAAGATKTTIRPIGSYTVNCFYLATEWSFPADVFECETTQIDVPE